MRGFYCITTFSLFLSLLSCNYNLVKDPAGTGQNSKQENPVSESALVDWTLVKSSVLSSCMSCHIGNTAPELGTRSSVQQNITLVLSEVHQNAMPPTKNGYSPLDDCKKSILEIWAQQGAPETTTIKVGDLKACLQNPPAQDPATTPIENAPLNYQTLLTKVLQPKCIKCHNPDSEDVEAAGILFYPYSEITKRSRLWSGPGKSSKIVKVLVAQDDTRMPPPEDATALAASEVDFISRWIDAGKPE